MRNLKRSLALVLTLALMIGVMAFGASAQYTDDADIQYSDAVALLSELGVINGYEDGSYLPKNPITRAEVSKLLCVVLNGGKEPVLGEVNTFSFTDTPGHWAAAYIEYVAALDIVAGMGDGTFAPEQTVTGQQLAKMVLVALNYDPDYESLVGVNWDSRTDALANQNGLYDGLAAGFQSTKLLNREEAAQIIFNALTVDRVVYQSAGYQGSVGVTAVKELPSMLHEYFNADELQVVVMANDEGTLIGTPDDVLAQEKTFVTDIDNFSRDWNEDDLDGFTAVIDAKTGLEDLGRSFIIFAKFNSRGYTGEIYGEPMYSSDNVVVKFDSEKSESAVKSSLASAGILLDDVYGVVNYNTPATLYTAGNGEATYTDLGDYLYDAAIDDSIDEYENDKGVIAYVIDCNGDGWADFILQELEFAGTVSSKTSKYIILDDMDGNPSIEVTYADFDDVYGTDDFVRNDVVLVSHLGDSLYIKTADAVVGKYTDVRFNTTNHVSDYEYTVGGTKYRQSEIPGTVDDVLDTYEDDIVVLYLDSCGYIIGYALDETAIDTYLYVDEIGHYSLGVQARLSFTDGEDAIAYIKKVDNRTLTSANYDEYLYENTIYQFTENDDGTYNLKSVVDQVSYAKNIELDKGAVVYPQNPDVTDLDGIDYLYVKKGNPNIKDENDDNVLKANIETIFVRVSNGTVETGYREVSSQEITKGAYLLDDDDIVSLFFIKDTDIDVDVSVKTFIIYDLDNVLEHANDEYTFNAVVGDDVEATVRVSDDVYDIIERIGAGLYTVDEMNSKGVITGIDAGEPIWFNGQYGAGYVEYYDGEDLITDSDDHDGIYAVNDDTVYVEIDLRRESAEIVTGENINDNPGHESYTFIKSVSSSNKHTAEVVYILLDYNAAQDADQDWLD